MIGLSLDDSQLIHVMQTSSSKDMWDALKGYHERSSLSSKVHVMRKMFATKMTEGGDISNHLKELCSLRLRLIALGEERSIKKRSILCRVNLVQFAKII